MKKSTKVLLILAVVFIALGTVFSGIGFALGVNPVKLIEQGYMDVEISGQRASQFSPKGIYNIAPDKLSDIELNWTEGEVRVELYEGDEIILQESCNEPLSEKNSLVYEVKKGTLYIYEFAGGIKLSVSPKNFISKDLILQIPESMALESLKINSVSTELFVDGLSLRELEIESVSGNVSVSSVKASELDMNSVSGKLSIEASEITELSVETVSGKFTAVLAAAPKELDFESISGSAEIYLPADSSFTVSKDSVSGKLDTDFEGRNQDKDFLVGSGRSEFDFETVSGSIKIYKAK